MAIAEIKWKLVKDTYLFDTTTCYLSENGDYMFYRGKEKRIEILIDDLNELVRKGCAMWLKLGEYDFYDFGLDKLPKCPTQTWYGIHQMLYSLEPWGVMKESKESTRKSIKESKSDLLIDIQNLISSSGLLDSIADVEDTLEIAYMIAERLDPSDYGFKDEDALANKINFELKYDREYAKLFESKKFVRKSIKEANESVIIDGKKTNFKINDYGTFFGEKIKYMLIGKPSENKDVLADFLEENSNFEFEEYKIPYSTVYYIYNDEKSLFGVAYRHYIRLTNDEKDAKIMLAYATDKRDLYNGL